MNSDGSLPRTLVVDFGSSRLKWALVSGTALGERGAFGHRGQELGPLLAQSWGRLEPPSRVLLASVAGPEHAETLCNWSYGHWGVRVEQVRSTARTLGVINAYAEPQRLGVDRWLALIAVRSRFAGPACIVDCGTAITIDGLAGDGRHLGGLILPGFGMMRQALLQGTGLDDLAPPPEPQWLARDTAGAIGYGGVLATVALVERLAERIERQCVRVPHIVVTGGDGFRLQPLLVRDSRYEPDLVLYGLVAISYGVES